MVGQPSPFTLPSCNFLLFLVYKLAELSFLRLYI